MGRLTAQLEFFISVSRYPWLKCTSHYFQLVWAALLTAGLVDEQN